MDDRLDAAFLPYMRHQGWTRQAVVANTAEWIQAIGDTEERNRTAALLLLISAKNLSKDAVDRLKEGLSMTDVVKIIGREEHQRGYEEGYEEGHEEGYEEGHEEGHEEGFEEGRQEGREEALMETARKLLASGMDVEQAAQFTGLDRTLLERLPVER